MVRLWVGGKGAAEKLHCFIFEPARVAIFRVASARDSPRDATRRSRMDGVMSCGDGYVGGWDFGNVRTARRPLIFSAVSVNPASLYRVSPNFSTKSISDPGPVIWSDPRNLKPSVRGSMPRSAMNLGTEAPPSALAMMSSRSPRPISPMTSSSSEVAEQRSADLAARRVERVALAGATARAERTRGLKVKAAIL